MPKMEMLTIRKHADRNAGERVVRYDADSGARKLVNPATPGDDHEPWPLLGVDIEDGDPPRHTRVSTTFVERAVAEGWAELEGERMVRRPGGPPTDPTAVMHRFVQADAVVFHFISGDVRYTVEHNPDKYDDPSVEHSGKRVDWFYDLKLEG